MRITCPCCGERDRREFTWQGDALALDRPARDAGEAAWDEYIHLRENRAGPVTDLWYHDPCGAWIVVERDNVTHAVHGARLASAVALSRAKFVWQEGDLRDVTPPAGTAP